MSNNNLKNGQAIGPTVDPNNNGGSNIADIDEGVNISGETIEFGGGNERSGLGARLSMESSDFQGDLNFNHLENTNEVADVASQLISNGREYGGVVYEEEFGNYELDNTMNLGSGERKKIEFRGLDGF